MLEHNNHGLINHQREKLINVMVYFAQNTQKCGKVKLFKLMYFLDFEHYKQIGRCVTGLNYYAWPMGPVPVDLYAEFDVPAPDMLNCVQFKPIPIKNGLMLFIQPIAEFDNRYFSKRELRLMADLATQYFETSAEEIIEASHLEHQPWQRVYIQEGKKQQLIPYEYVLTSGEKEVISELSQAHQEGEFFMIPGTLLVYDNFRFSDGTKGKKI
ncbi:MAG: hypothetical protein DRR16_16695 [Candidatus Parabeggiatoa sp. nov. 3]|nr:MAG: hypothetical protein DRR00_21375 [Gammaproteobacteria bacterium]RKZ58253.1 MAG: hypothetical protein DRQ99_25730 [Gammaproteobacteria bacterium]RKZ83664.1 MAG: hypothetical protein DRR16_16695 [Gammaproteobacteria bacterium]